MTLTSLPIESPSPETEAHERIPGRVSFVIPTKDSGRTITACVRSVVEQGGDVEVVVVDNHSADGTADRARAAGADEVLLAGPERSAQRNRGWERSTGELVVFVDSDMVLRPGLADAVRRAFADEPVTGALVVPEYAFGDGYLARCRALEKRAYLGDRRAEAARAFRHVALAAGGGYDEAINAFEDYELADRVEAQGWRTGRTDVAVDHDEGRIRLRGLFAKKRYYGSTLHSTRHAVEGFDWRRRGSRSWGRLAQALVADPWHAPGLIVLKVVDAAGLLLGHWRRSGP